MSTPVVYCCPDGHFRRVIFGLGPFIADYPEQVMLTGVKQGWCPRYVLRGFSCQLLKLTTSQLYCITEQY